MTGASEGARERLIERLREQSGWRERTPYMGATSELLWDAIEALTAQPSAGAGEGARAQDAGKIATAVSVLASTLKVAGRWTSEHERINSDALDALGRLAASPSSVREPGREEELAGMLSVAGINLTTASIALRKLGAGAEADMIGKAADAVLTFLHSQRAPCAPMTTVEEHLRLPRSVVNESSVVSHPPADARHMPSYARMTEIARAEGDQEVGAGSPDASKGSG